MSFFRNLRSSITRGRSSSRDTTPVRSSRNGSIISGNSKRRDSVESNSDSVFNRSDTFIVDDTTENGLNSNTSTLEKKSKKSKVLGKFSTFTKRKKTPTPDSSAFEHHPSDNATNTYYKWQAEGCNSLDYDSQTDPFNFLYDQTSLKSIHNGSSGPESTRSSSTVPAFDSSTYRKGKMPSELKKQLEQLKQSQYLPEQEDHDEIADEEHLARRTEFEEEGEANKYKTVTLNSFRKSFRDKFLQQQKEAPHNPSWFVEVEPPAVAVKDSARERSASKENRTDFLVFENENYRPGSRSPIRDLNTRRPGRSVTRSPVKRNETFKVERNPNTPLKVEETTPSIRIEFRNSITPNVPGRMVPVGVAKPMPSQITTPYYGRSDPAINSSYATKTSTTRLNSHQSPLRNWTKPLSSRSPSQAAAPAATVNSGHNQRTGRYQTLVQIKNDGSGISKMPSSPAFTGRQSRLSTRIQLGGASTVTATANPSPSPTFAKRYHNSQHFINAKTPQPLKQTYFGDNNYLNSPRTSARMVQTSTRHSTTRTFGLKTEAAPAFGGKYQTPSHHVASSSSSLSTLTHSRSTPSHSAASLSGGGGGSSHSYLKHQQPPSRIVVASQRRSRSPIKIPWR